MPYFIYRIEQQSGQLVKKLTFNNSVDNYKQAKNDVNALRESIPEESGRFWKIVFAESQLQAEELLQEKRDKPVLMEWEK
ncbi:MAG: hypothetical protein GY806_04795 [Gammaproteobacteria bacterium]|nr:hypothetical protein [Gammaproteobacteria bacterium]